MEEEGLEKELEASSSHMYHVTTKVALVIHPSRSHDVSGGVREQLNQMLLRYNSHVEGVVLAITSWNPLQRTGRILNGLDSYFRVNIAAKLMVFKPQVGQLLEARVNFVGRAHVGFLFMGVFNGRVAGAEVSESFEFQSGEKRWDSKVDATHHIKVGTRIRFTVVNVNVDKFGFIEISGSLREGGTGACGWLDRGNPPGSSPRRSREQDAASGSKRKARSRESKDERAGQSLGAPMETDATRRLAEEGDVGCTPRASRKECHDVNGHGRADNDRLSGEVLEVNEGRGGGPPSRSHKSEKKRGTNGLLKRERVEDADENGKDKSKSNKKRKKKEQ